MHYYPSSFGLVLTQEGQLAVGPSADRADQNDVKQIMNLVNNRSKRETSGGIEIAEFVGSKNQSEGTVYFTSLKEYPHWQVVLVNYDNEVFEPIKRMRFRNMILILSGLLVLFFIINRFARNEKRLRQAGIKQTRIDSELHIASAIQQTMLPKTFPPFPERNDIDIYGSLVPAKEVGGDLFDFYIRDEKLFFCIGDVSGKGVPASLFMAVTRSVFRTVSAHESMPERIMTTINKTMYDMNKTFMFVTLFVGVLDLPTGRLYYCNAGHDAPLLVGAGVGELPCDPNIPVGVRPKWVYTLQEAQIFTGTTIFLFTDGLTEAMDVDSKQFKMERVMNTAREALANHQLEPKQLIDGMTEAVHQFVGEAEQSDDLTMMAIQYIKQQSDVKLLKRIMLTNDLKEVPKLNEFVTEMCETVGMNHDDAVKVKVAIEEAVVNVMKYAYPDGTTGDVTIEAASNDERLKFTIVDGGKVFDPTVMPEVDTTLSAKERRIGGLGIHIMRQYMDSMNYERIDNLNVLTLSKNINN